MLGDQMNLDALEGIPKSGKNEGIVLTNAQKAAWKKAMAPVRKDSEARVGKDTLEAVCKPTGFKP